jgi:hypothetical protein
MTFGKNYSWIGPSDGKFTDQHQQQSSIEVTQFGGGNGGGMEPRIAKLQSDVGHIQSDIAEIKGDVKTIRDKIDDVKESISSAKIWALLLYIALAAVLLGVMARGFKWI